MTAQIEKISDFPSSPELLLAMCQSNLKGATSAVVSIEVDGRIQTYWTQMNNTSLAFHLFCIQQELTERINSAEDQQ